jgi:hypothetical protein
MRKVICPLRLAVLLVFVAIAALSGEAYAQLACYTWDAFPAFRFKLDLREHSFLSEPTESPSQFALSVHGKLVSAAIPATRPTTGTVVSTIPLGQPSQAHLGLLSSAAAPELRDVHVKCQAGDAPGFPPPVWQCFSYNDFGVFHGASMLTLVKESEDPVCGTFIEDQATAAGSAVAGSTNERDPSGPR